MSGRAELEPRAMEMIEAVDWWRSIDRWWSDQPEERLWVALEAPDGSHAAIGYDPFTKTWTLEVEPR